jgi:ABC-2 type transport system permease protein
VTAARRVGSEFRAAWHSFLRRRTAVVFTFLFPVLIVLIFGVLVETQPTGGGIFARPPAYYVPGYLAVVVLFTPLSRVGSTVARHREGNRFEKLATTPLSRAEWLLAHTLVNVVLVGVAALVLLVLTTTLTGASVAVGPALGLLPALVALATALFCGVGAVLGRVADSQDGVVAASNTLALPLLFLSETFVTPTLLPEWFRPLALASPVTYFARGVRVSIGLPATQGGSLPDAGLAVSLGVLVGLTAVALAAGAVAIPRTD